MNYTKNQFTTKKTTLLLSAALLFGSFFTSCVNEAEEYRMLYDGTPFIDSIGAMSVQTLPGKLQCEFYDNGGEGIAFHDTDKSNSGSGGLNQGTDYLNSFRKKEAVDISYTKFHDQIDNSPYSIVQPEKDQFYVGWTEPKEWIRYSVDVLETGNYKIGTMYTSNRGGEIRIFIDDTDSTEFLNIPTTFDTKEPLSWRQWHHWNQIDSLCTQYISKGRRIVTLKIEKQGNFNFDYINFQKID